MDVFPERREPMSTMRGAAWTRSSSYSLWSLGHRCTSVYISTVGRARATRTAAQAARMKGKIISARISQDDFTTG